MGEMGWEQSSGPVRGLAGPQVLYSNRKAQGQRGAVEPALSGCVMVTVCWYLALTGKDSGTTIPDFGSHLCPPSPGTHIPVRHVEAVFTHHLLDGWMGGREGVS